MIPAPENPNKKPLSSGAILAIVFGTGLLLVGLLVALGISLLGGLRGSGSVTGVPAPPVHLDLGTTSHLPTTPAAQEPARNGEVKITAPTSGAVFEASGTMTQMQLDPNEDDVIQMPTADEPFLVTWANSAPGGNGLLYVVGFEKPGGEIKGSLRAIKPGQTGMGVINRDPGSKGASVLYPQGNKGVKWKIKGFPLSSAPSVDRGVTAKGTGPAVVRIKAGAEVDYIFKGLGSNDAVSISVYDAKHLEYWDEYEFGTSPTPLTVPMAEGERLVVVESGGDWTLSPR